jgi:hypothetical protein
MVPLFLGAAVIGSVLVWQTGQLHFSLAPIAVVPLWMLLRLQTPRGGMRVATIRSTPGAVVMLWFVGAALISMAILFAIDVYIFRHPYRAPLEPYHAAILAPPFLIMFTGAYWADRIAKAQRSKDSPDEDDGAAG